MNHLTNEPFGVQLNEKLRQSWMCPLPLEIGAGSEGSLKKVLEDLDQVAPPDTWVASECCQVPSCSGNTALSFLQHYRAANNKGMTPKSCRLTEV